MLDFWQAFVENLAANVAAAFLGVIAAWVLRNVVERLLYGGWRVIVLKGGAIKVNRAISIGKAKEIKQEPAELSVFLKGVASPYGWINCDIIEEGQKIGLLEQDARGRRYTINLDKNPQAAREGPTIRDVMGELRRLSGQRLPEPTDAGATQGDPCGEQEVSDRP